MALFRKEIQLGLLLLHHIAVLDLGSWDPNIPIQKRQAVQHKVVLLLRIVSVNWILDYHIPFVSLVVN